MKRKCILSVVAILIVFTMIVPSVQAYQKTWNAFDGGDTYTYKSPGIFYPPTAYYYKDLKNMAVEVEMIESDPGWPSYAEAEAWLYVDYTADRNWAPNQIEISFTCPYWIYIYDKCCASAYVKVWAEICEDEGGFWSSVALAEMRYLYKNTPKKTAIEGTLYGGYFGVMWHSPGLGFMYGSNYRIEIHVLAQCISATCAVSSMHVSYFTLREV